MSHPKKIFDFNYIQDGIYIGTNQCCQMHFDKMLLSQEVTYDISLEKERLDTPFGVESYIWIPTEDHEAPTADQLKFGVYVIEEIVEMGKKVYVHCKNGHGRAPTLVAAYLIKKGKTIQEAIEIISRQRPVVHLDNTQIEALKEFSGRPKIV